MFEIDVQHENAFFTSMIRSDFYDSDVITNPIGDIEKIVIPCGLETKGSWIDSTTGKEVKAHYWVDFTVVLKKPENNES